MQPGEPNDILLYLADDGETRLEVQLDHETVWLTQKQMAELFERDSDTVGLHIRNLYKEGELLREATTEESSVVQTEGDRKVQYYNLDMIISVDYRIKSMKSGESILNFHGKDSPCNVSPISISSCS
jgi:hypothetical protein